MKKKKKKESTWESPEQTEQGHVRTAGWREKLLTKRVSLDQEGKG